MDELMILDSYPSLRQAKARYCAMVSRDRDNPRRRTALGGNGRQVLELRSEVCGTLTTVQKDTLLLIQHGSPIKF